MMSSDLEKIKAKSKLAGAEPSGDEAKIAKFEAEVIKKENLLIEQQKEKNLLMAEEGNRIHFFDASFGSF
jgi:hypothetical protein